LRLGLSQQRDSKDHRQYDNKFFHIVTSTDVKFDFWLRHAAKGIVGNGVGASADDAAEAIPMEWRRYAVQGDYRCWFCIPLANRRSLGSLEAFIVDSTFFASCEIVAIHQGTTVKSRSAILSQ
jgi:hypothetical protein